MMKKIAKKITGLVTAMVILSSCKKDKEISQTELLTKQPWKLTAFIQKNLTTGAEQDNFAPMSTCYKDDNYVYKPDMSFEANAGAVKCNAADPQVFQSGSWRFTNNETILETTITSGNSAGSVFEYSITSVTGTTLKMHTVQGGSDYIFTFSH